jgi:23S rRNA (guanosine2251-2'-O)-methyltransferase
MNLICGVNPVLEALAAGTRHFDRLLIVKGLRGKRLAEAIRRATQLGIPLRFEMRETLDRMGGGVPHQGIIAIVSEKPVLSLEALLSAVHDPALLVVLDGIEDPRNLGAILRTAEAAGADGVLLPERHSAGLSETVARASAGALEHVRVARVGNLVQALEQLKQRGVWVVGFDAAGTERWDAVDFNRPVALVLGGEGRGMRRLVREHCDHLVSIPHFGHVTSLNVSVAAGVALYEAVRQRKAVPSVVRPIPERVAQAPEVIGPGPDDDGEEPGFGGVRAEWRDEAEAEGEEHELTTPAIPHVDFHEDVAWGRGPTVLKPIEFQRAHRPGGRPGARRGKPGKAGKRREHLPQEHAPTNGADGPSTELPPNDGAVTVASAPAPASAPAGAESGPRRGGRRRRRGRRPGGEPGQAPPSGGEAGREARPSQARADAGPGGNGAPGPGGGRRRRRRRRR